MQFFPFKLRYTNQINSCRIQLNLTSQNQLDINFMNLSKPIKEKRSSWQLKKIIEGEYCLNDPTNTLRNLP